MKYWTMCYPGDCGPFVSETWSEEQILRSIYAAHWKEKMMEVGKHDEISDSLCIADWIIVNWATETDHVGNPINPPQELMGS